MGGFYFLFRALMTNENIARLETKLEQLKQQFKTETTFDPNELQRRQNYQRTQVLLEQSFRYDSLKDLLVDFILKLKDGYNFTFDQQAQHAPERGAYIRLLKPETMLQDEYVTSDQDIEATYLAELETKKNELILQITQKSVELATAREDAKESDRRQKAFERELEKIQKELNCDQQKTSMPTNKNNNKEAA